MRKPIPVLTAAEAREPQLVFGKDLQRNTRFLTMATRHLPRET